MQAQNFFLRRVCNQKSLEAIALGSHRKCSIYIFLFRLVIKGKQKEETMTVRPKVLTVDMLGSETNSFLIG